MSLDFLLEKHAPQGTFSCHFVAIHLVIPAEAGIQLGFSGV